MVTTKYTHLELNKDVTAIAGYYTPQNEVRLKYGDREVLYVVGQSIVESSCCGAGRWGYAIVPGYIVNWQSEVDKNGLPVSEVEPISDPETRTEIRQIIEEAEPVTQVEFW